MTDELLWLKRVADVAALKSRQLDDQAFGDSRVEDAAHCLEDIAMMLCDKLPALAAACHRSDSRDDYLGITAREEPPQS